VLGEWLANSPGWATQLEKEAAQQRREEEHAARSCGNSSRPNARGRKQRRKRSGWPAQQERERERQAAAELTGQVPKSTGSGARTSAAPPSASLTCSRCAAWGPAPPLSG
jgi:hypothetical protein